MINIKILSIDGCKATPPTIELVKSIAAEMNGDLNLTHVVINTPEQAQKERFLGSPTVQINGIDIEPNARDIQFFGVT